jgi:hypothetical protein
MSSTSTKSNSSSPQTIKPGYFLFNPSEIINTIVNNLKNPDTNPEDSIIAYVSSLTFKFKNQVVFYAQKLSSLSDPFEPLEVSLYYQQSYLKSIGDVKNRTLLALEKHQIKTRSKTVQQAPGNFFIDLQYLPDFPNLLKNSYSELTVDLKVSYTSFERSKKNGDVAIKKDYNYSSKIGEVGIEKTRNGYNIYRVNLTSLSNDSSTYNVPLRFVVLPQLPSPEIKINLSYSDLNRNDPSPKRVILYSTDLGNNKSTKVLYEKNPDLSRKNSYLHVSQDLIFPNGYMLLGVEKARTLKLLVDGTNYEFPLDSLNIDLKNPNSVLWSPETPDFFIF